MILVVSLNYTQISDYKYDAKVGAVEHVTFKTKETINPGDEIEIYYTGAQVKYYDGNQWQTTDRIFYGVAEGVKKVGDLYYVEAYGIYYKLKKRHIKTVFTVYGTTYAGGLIKAIVGIVFGSTWADSNVIILGTDKAISSETIDIAFDMDGMTAIENIAYSVGARLVYWQDKLYVVYPDGEADILTTDFKATKNNVSNMRVNKSDFGVYNEVVVEGAVDTFQDSVEEYIDLSNNPAIVIFPRDDKFAPDSILAIYLDGRPIPLNRVSKVNDRQYTIDFSGYGEILYPDWQYYNDITIKNNTSIQGSDIMVRLDLSNRDEIDYSSINHDDNGIPTDLRFVELTSTGLVGVQYYIDEAVTDVTQEKLVVWLKLPVFGDSAIVRMYYGNADATSASNIDAVMPKIFDNESSYGYWLVSENTADEEGQYSVTINNGDPIKMHVEVDCSNDNGTSIASIIVSGEANYYVFEVELANGDFTGNQTDVQSSEIDVYDWSNDSWQDILDNDTENSTVSKVASAFFGDDIGSLKIRTMFNGFCGTNTTAGGSADGYLYYVRAGKYAYDVDIDSISPRMDNGYGYLVVSYSYARPYVGVAYDFTNANEIKSIKVKLGWVTSDELAQSIANEILNKYKSENITAEFSHILGYWLKIMSGWNVGFNVNVEIDGVTYQVHVLSINVDNGLVRFKVGRRIFTFEQYLRRLESRLTLLGMLKPRNFPYLVEDFANNNVDIKWW